MDTLTSFVRSYLQAASFFDYPELAGVRLEVSSERTRSGEVPGRDRGLATDPLRGRYGGLS